MNFKLIVDEVLKGNEKPLEIIYKDYRNIFITYATNKFKISKDLAKEIFQEIIIEFNRNIISGKLIKLECTLKTYLFEIGNHLILKEIERDKRIIRFSGQDLENKLYENPPDHGKKDFIDLKEMIKKEFRLLGERCFKILDLYYFKRKSMTEIAIECGFSNEISAKTQKYKCFEKLKLSVKEKYKIENLI